MKPLCALLLFMLSACGAPTGTPSAEPKPPVQILWIGDSLSAQNFYPVPGAPALGERSSDLLQVRLGPGVQINNAAVDATGTAYWLANLPPLLAAQPTIVLVELGINDKTLSAGSLTAEQTRENLRTLFTMIHQANGFPIFLAVDWNNPALEREYVRVCADMNVPILRDYLAGEYQQPDFTVDGAHPNAAGAVILADNVYPLLNLVLQR